MRLVYNLHAGNVPMTVNTINKRGLGRFVLQIIALTPADQTQVIYRAEDYPSYLRLCEKLCINPVTTEEFFK